MGLTLIGTIAPARLESQQLTPPGKLTVTMVRDFFGDVDTEPPICPIKGLTYVGHTTETPPEGGFGKIRWKYEGVVGVVSGGANSGGGNVDPMQEVAELEIGLDQVPLGMHPNIKEIIEKFGGAVKDGELSFPRKDPTGESTRESVDEDNNPIKLNPFYGITSYLSPRARFRLRRMNPSFGGGSGAGNSSNAKGQITTNYSTTDASAAINGLGDLEAPPWPLGERTNWLKSSVSTRQHGQDSEVTEEWLYSFTGWSTDIYDDWV